MANIRKANISDANACAEIVHSWVQATSWMPNRFTLAELETLVEEVMPKREIWVVGDPIFAYLSFDRPNNSIAALYSKNPGQGYGRQLINHIKNLNILDKNTGNLNPVQVMGINDVLKKKASISSQNQDMFNSIHS